MPENGCQLQFRKCWQRELFLAKKAEDGNGLPVVKRGGMAWGLKNYLPPYQGGEDASTMDAHRERLHIQHSLSSAKREQQIIRKLMDLTFPHRKNLLIREMATIREVTDLYSLLQDEIQVT